jgi:hypothetical protein
MKMINETHPYRLWLDSFAGYAGVRFATLEEAVQWTITHRAPFHLVRVELNGECQAITLPQYYWEKN